MRFWNLKIGWHITDFQQNLPGLSAKTRALGLGLVREAPQSRNHLKRFPGVWKSEAGVDNVDPKNATLFQSDPI